MKGLPTLKICGESVLWDLWEEKGDFREAFVEWAERLLVGYDCAVESGLLPTTHDLVHDEDGDALTEGSPTRRPGYDTLMAALLSGDANLGVAELSRQHNLDRTTVRRVAARMGIQITRRHDTMRLATEALVKDGVTQPRRIIAQLEQQFPGVPLPKANTITVWKRRMRENA